MVAAGISFVAAVCVSINLMMGSGFLALPHAWLQGGASSGFALLVVVVIMCICAVLEARFVIKGSRVLRSSHICEVADVVRLCCGEVWRSVYLAVLCISLGGCMWTYAVVFGRSFAFYLFPAPCSEESSGGEISGECLVKYRYGIALLAAITTPLCLIEVKEQVGFQLAMTAMRVLLVLLMVSTALAAHFMGEVNSSFYHSNNAGTSNSASNNGVVYFISAASFALFLNSNVPIVINALREGVCIERVLMTAFMCCLLLYGILSISLASSLSSLLLSPCNLNWVQFKWPAVSVCSNLCDYSAKALEVLIVLFPAIDVLSVYPINTMILANSFDGSKYNNSSPVAYHSLEGADDEAPRVSAPQAISSFCCHATVRVVINLLPLLLAALFYDFTALIDYSGVMSLLICFVFPAFISLQYDKNVMTTPVISTSSAVEMTPLTSPTMPQLQLSGTDCDTSHNNNNNSTTVLVLSRLIESQYLKASVLAIGVVMMAIIIADGAYK